MASSDPEEAVGGSKNFGVNRGLEYEEIRGYTSSVILVTLIMLLPAAGPLVSYTQCRALHTSVSLLGKRNFRKFLVGAKAGTIAFKKERAKEISFKKRFPDIDIPDNGTRPTGARRQGDGAFIRVPEMVPELVVPDLTGFKLKPYVSYRCPDVVQEEFTARDLFNSVYSEKITADFTKGALAEDGQPVEPSAEEALTADQARHRARAVYSDIWEK